jgi:hypothetical protein
MIKAPTINESLMNPRENAFRRKLTVQKTPKTSVSSPTLPRFPLETNVDARHVERKAITSIVGTKIVVSKQMIGHHLQIPSDTKVLAIQT